jgi:benzodiazapine receptor
MNTESATGSSVRSWRQGLKPWQVRTHLVVIACLVVAIVSLFIDSSILDWYDSLHKPSFTPPIALFAVVWTVLYGCMAASAWMIWKMPRTRHTTRALMLFAIQFMLGTLWTLDFFHYHVIGPALLLIVLFWIALLLTTVRFWQLRRATIYLTAPCLVWVSFASLLNLEIALFN